jgi:hypothetical protein
MRFKSILLLLLFLFLIGSAAHAASSQEATVAPTYAHPDLPAPDRVWPPVMIAFVAVMFISAMCIGAYMHLEDPSDLPPPAHSHDEPPGSSGHHGPGGTMQPAPENELHSHSHH